MTTWRRRQRQRRDLHFLTEDGAVACNPRDREAAHRAEMEAMATENRSAVSCKKCLLAMRRLDGRPAPDGDGARFDG